MFELVICAKTAKRYKSKIVYYHATFKGRYIHGQITQQNVKQIEKLKNLSFTDRTYFLTTSIDRVKAS